MHGEQPCFTVVTMQLSLDLIPQYMALHDAVDPNSSLIDVALDRSV